MTTATAPHATAQMGPHLRAITQLHLVDHVQMVHNALGAVHSLAMPRSGNGVSPSGAFEDMHMLRQNHLVDLLEIINDRLATALETEAYRTARCPA